MSLFTDALGGAGAAAQNMSDVWIKEESQGNLQKLQADLETNKQRLIAKLQADNQAVQNTQGIARDAANIASHTAAQKDLIDYQSSASVTANRAEQEGAIARARSENTRYEMNPGGRSYIGADEQAHNDSLTAAQITDARLKARGAGKPREISADDTKRIAVWQEEIKGMEKNLDDDIKGIDRKIEHLTKDYSPSAMAIRKNPNGPEAIQLKKLQDEIDIKRTKYQNDIELTRARIRKIVEPEADASPTAAPAPAPAPKSTANTLPAGARKIGTSGGKDVYEAPDGTRYIVK